MPHLKNLMMKENLIDKEIKEKLKVFCKAFEHHVSINKK